MIKIDGSIGEGGGQILRSALGLSMVTGLAFRIENIRAGRVKPGLLRQHLTAVNAASDICSALTEGAAIGSQSLTFQPGKVKPGAYTFSIGSAGSTTLVLQSILPALLLAGGESTVMLEGGTHNPHAPPFHFLERAFAPLINRMGPRVELTLNRAGFYPAGGGQIAVKIAPCPKLSALHLPDRGEIKRKVAMALVAALPGEIAKRELEKVNRRLGWEGNELQIQQLPSEWGPGNVLMLQIESEHLNEVFTSFGMKRTTAEAVADDAVQQVREYLTGGNAVGPYLADQLLIPIALAGSGSFQTGGLTRHALTNIQIIERFLPVRFTVEPVNERSFCVTAKES